MRPINEKEKEKERLQKIIIAMKLLAETIDLNGKTAEPVVWIMALMELAAIMSVSIKSTPEMIAYLEYAFTQSIKTLQEENFL